jgi:hypothetical protein
MISYNKFRNKKTTTSDGKTFASKKEANRYEELKLLQKYGKIKDIELQPRIPLLVNGKSIGYYIGDFRYYDNEKQRLILEDVKSPITKTPIYKLKKKILETYQPPIEIIEIF